MCARRTCNERHVGLVGGSARMIELRRCVIRLASCEVPVLLHGESGTGKELVAGEIHRLSSRSDGPFVGVNCAAVHESLLESELFGHKTGAFTGASHDALGFLRSADGGTILLDEVGDMSVPLQSKLLRVLEQREVIPVGDTRGVPIDVRVIAATHRDLGQAVEEGSFRLDLYYRLNVVRLDLPPMREHPEDIPELVSMMLARIADVLDVPPKTVSPAAMQRLTCCRWPGNVRQLGNAIQRAYALGDGEAIEPEDLGEDVLSEHDAPSEQFPSLEDAVAGHVRRALAVSGGIRTRAAGLLGIDRKSLWRMMRRYDIDA